MGALTSKPYSFKARSWELRVFPYYDLFFSFVIPLRFHIYNNDLLRVLPMADPAYTFWIYDYIRFSYDAYLMQRLTLPLRMVKFKVKNEFN